ncbi:MAG: hypothetical protein KGH63_04300, partial [Candidatus Micrarchaeota archaeon]|nr:hypothetical protein [Candidatus Micrarchaeota archaeon]
EAMPSGRDEKSIGEELQVIRVALAQLHERSLDRASRASMESALRQAGRAALKAANPAAPPAAGANGLRPKLA